MSQRLHDVCGYKIRETNNGDQYYIVWSIYPKDLFFKCQISELIAYYLRQSMDV